MKKEELNLPWEYDHRMGCIYDNKKELLHDEALSSEDQTTFLLKAVNTYHEREELIRELALGIEYLNEYVKYLLGATDEYDFKKFSERIAIQNNFNGSFDDLIQKAKKLLEES